MGICVNLDNIQKNIIIELKESITPMKIGVQTMGLGCIVGTIFRGLGDLSKQSDPQSVISVISQSSNIMMYSCVVISALAFIYLMKKEDEKNKLPDYIKIPKEDFENMKLEIIQLREKLIKV